jgi:hypothetical protein
MSKKVKIIIIILHGFGIMSGFMLLLHIRFTKGCEYVLDDLISEYFHPTAR